MLIEFQPLQRFVDPALLGGQNNPEHQADLPTGFLDDLRNWTKNVPVYIGEPTEPPQPPFACEVAVQPEISVFGDLAKEIIKRCEVDWDKDSGQMGWTVYEVDKDRAEVDMENFFFLALKDAGIQSEGISSATILDFTNKYGKGKLHKFRINNGMVYFRDIEGLGVDVFSISYESVFTYLVMSTNVDIETVGVPVTDRVESKADTEAEMTRKLLWVVVIGGVVVVGFFGLLAHRGDQKRRNGRMLALSEVNRSRADAAIPGKQEISLDDIKTAYIEESVMRMGLLSPAEEEKARKEAAKFYVDEADKRGFVPRDPPKQKEVPKTEAKSKSRQNEQDPYEEDAYGDPNYGRGGLDALFALMRYFSDPNRRTRRHPHPPDVIDVKCSDLSNKQPRQLGKGDSSNPSNPPDNFIPKK